jgi:hypothetical protein
MACCWQCYWHGILWPFSKVACWANPVWACPGHSGPRSCSTGTRPSMHLLSLPCSSISNLTANPWDPAWVSSSGHCKVVSRSHFAQVFWSSGRSVSGCSRYHNMLLGFETCYSIMFGWTTNILHDCDWIPVSTTKVPLKITATKR